MSEDLVEKIETDSGISEEEAEKQRVKDNYLRVKIDVAFSISEEEEKRAHERALKDPTHYKFPLLIQHSLFEEFLEPGKEITECPYETNGE